MQQRMLILQWLVSGFLFLLFLLVASINLRIGWREIINKDFNGPSIFPFVGGWAGYFGILLSPVQQAHNFCWIPMIVDYGCLPYLVLALASPAKKP